MKFAVIIVVIFVGVLFALVYLTLHSDRHAMLVNGRHELKIALSDLQKTGAVHDHTTMLLTNTVVISHPFLFTNVAVIDGTSYRCAVALDISGMGGVMAATTNGDFIYFDKKQGPRLIPAD